MSVISHMGVDYGPSSYQVQDNASATDLDNTKIPTGQTIENYVKNSYSKSNVTLNGDYNTSTVYYRNVSRSANVKVIHIAYLSKAISTVNTWYNIGTVPSEYSAITGLEGYFISSQKKYINVRISGTTVAVCAREAVTANDLFNFELVYI